MGSHLHPPAREGRSSGILQGQDSCHQAPRERSIPGSITTLQTARSAQIAKNLHLFGFDEAKFFKDRCFPGAAVNRLSFPTEVVGGSR